MLFNKRGAALLQVLIVTAILAGMSAMILRFSLARTITSRQTRHVVNAQRVIEACMAEVNAIWAAKNPSAYAEDLAQCRMFKPYGDYDGKSHTCQNIPFGEGELNKYNVVATIEEVTEREENSATPPCRITYTIENNSRLSL